MAEGSGLSAEIYYEKIPVAEGVRDYMAQRIFPDATTRNWSSYSDKVKFMPGVNVMEAFTLLPDPQTNGGLLVCVSDEGLNDVHNIMGSEIIPVGKMLAENEKRVWVK
jgi:selenide,water dikinase